MQKCPNCGRDLPTHVTHCKYCETRLPSPVAGSLLTLLCPTCNGSLSPRVGETIVRCPYCGNTVLIPATLWAKEEEQPLEPPTLSAQVEALVRQGREDKAVQLLRDEGLLPREEAETIVAQIVTGQYADVADLIVQARRRG